MLEMTRLQDGKQKSALLTELGVDTSEVFVYAAYEGGNQIGYAVFENLEGKVTVTYAEYQDEDLLDGLIRSGMAWMDDCGFSELYFSDQLDANLLKKLYFISDESNYVNSIGDFLKTCKKCRM